MSCARFNHNTSSIASGSETGEIILYNVITGQGCRPLTTPRAQVRKQYSILPFCIMLWSSLKSTALTKLLKNLQQMSLFDKTVNKLVLTGEMIHPSWKQMLPC